jgi:cobaltochelatase CobS
MSDRPLTVAERDILRAAIRSHPEWKAYRQANHIDASGLNAGECRRACAVMKIDIEAALAAATETNSTEGTEDMKDRSVAPFTFGAAVTDFRAVADRMDTEAREKCESIIKTVETRQDGWATTAQLGFIERTARLARDKAPGATTSTATTEAATVKPGQIETAPAPAAPVTADPAGAALAAMIAPHIMGTLTPAIARMVEQKLEGAVAVRIEVGRADGSVGKVEGHSHPKLATLLRALSVKQANGFAVNVFLVGSTSSGKTHGAGQAAKALGRTFGAHGAMMMQHELMGFIDAPGKYHRTPFRDAFEHGGVVLLDEVDSWDASVTLSLNAALANGYASFPDGMIARHPDCIIIGGANTHGTGATAEYVGRNRLDAAFLSRFPVRIQWDPDPALEVAISGNPEFARRVQAARERARSAGLKHLIDARQMQAGAALIAAGFTSDEAADMTYLAGLSKEQRRMVEGA